LKYRYGKPKESIELSGSLRLGTLSDEELKARIDKLLFVIK